jgi:Domain of unknown function (DUF4129)
MVIIGTDAGPVGGDAAQKAARAELEHGEYHRDDPGLVSRVLHWFGRRLDDVFNSGGSSHGLLLVLVVVAAVAIVFAIRAGVPSRSPRLGHAADIDPLATVAARDHRRIAAQLTAEGRRAEALREWLRAAVATIEERGVLPPRPGRTGAATAREAGALLPTAAADLEAAMRAFDEVWFGGREATDHDVARAERAAEGVQSARIAAPSGTETLAVPR